MANHMGAFCQVAVGPGLRTFCVLTAQRFRRRDAPTAGVILAYWCPKLRYT
jgi:hypothetical protein